VSGPIRNVVLFVGDGMGAGQVAAARCYAGTNLAFEALLFQSRISTFSAGGEVTDSAAAATALATGRKVSSLVVSLAVPGDGGELETVLERFGRLGKSTGLVTSSYLTDATPAAFGAHASSRYSHAEIAADYLGQTRPNVLFGGGGVGLTAQAAQAAGYQVAADASALAALRNSPHPHLAGLFGEGAMPYVADGLGGLPGLAQMTEVALARLSRDPDGFFLMVEGGRIDHACHAGDLFRCVTETLAFDEAVRAADGWAQGRSDTLLVVVADHETGGLEVLQDAGAGALPVAVWRAWGVHTSAPVGVYGWGVNAERVAGLTDNTELVQVLCSEALMPATGVGVDWSPGAPPRVSWAVSSGDVCRVEYSPTLAAPAWEPCGVVTASGPRVTWAFEQAQGQGQGFFRAVTLPGQSPE
jgi:alkaline phosphatase